MIPSLVDTSLDFGLFRVVRPYRAVKKFVMSADPVALLCKDDSFRFLEGILNFNDIATCI